MTKPTRRKYTTKRARNGCKSASASERTPTQALYVDEPYVAVLGSGRLLRHAQRVESSQKAQEQQMSCALGRTEEGCRAERMLRAQTRSHVALVFIVAFLPETPHACKASNAARARCSHSANRNVRLKKDAPHSFICPHQRPASLRFFLFPSRLRRKRRKQKVATTTFLLFRTEMTATMTSYRATTGLHQGNPIWHGTLQLHGNVTSFQTEAIAVPTTSAPRPDWGKVLHLHARQCTPVADHRREVLATRFCFRLIAVDERGFPREEPRLDAIAAVMEEGKLLFRVRVENGWILVWGIHDERGNSSLLGGFYADGTLNPN